MELNRRKFFSLLAGAFGALVLPWKAKAQPVRGGNWRDIKPGDPDLGVGYGPSKPVMREWRTVATLYPNKLWKTKLVEFVFIDFKLDNGVTVNDWVDIDFARLIAPRRFPEATYGCDDKGRPYRVALQGGQFDPTSESDIKYWRMEIVEMDIDEAKRRYPYHQFPACDRVQLGITSLKA
jgi:hypothetical protein